MIIIIQNVALKGGSDMTYVKEERRVSNLSMAGIVFGLLPGLVLGAESIIAVLGMFFFWGILRIGGGAIFAELYNLTEGWLAATEVIMGLCLALLFVSLIKALIEDDNLRSLWLPVTWLMLMVGVAAYLAIVAGLAELGNVPMLFQTTLDVAAVPLIHAVLIILSFGGFALNDILRQIQIKRLEPEPNLSEGV